MNINITTAPTWRNGSNVTDHNNINRLILSIIMNLSLGTIALTVNICVCSTIIFKKALHEPFYYLILNLSISDMLLAIAVLINGYLDYEAYQSLLSPKILSDTVCQLDIFCAIVSFCASSLTLLTISIERYQFVIMRIGHRIKLEKTRMIIVGIWFLAFLTAIIPTRYSKIEYFNPNECIIQTIPIKVLAYIEVILTVFTCILPFPVMLICYVIIANKLFRLNSINPTISIYIKAKNDRMKKNIVAIIIISILSASTGLPLIIMNIAVTFSDGNYHLAQTPLLWAIASTLFVLSPILNPILYNFGCKKFRQIFISMYCRHCTRYT